VDSEATTTATGRCLRSHSNLEKKQSNPQCSERKGKGISSQKYPIVTKSEKKNIFALLLLHEKELAKQNTVKEKEGESLFRSILLR